MSELNVIFLPKTWAVFLHCVFYYEYYRTSKLLKKLLNNSTFQAQFFFHSSKITVLPFMKKGKILLKIAWPLLIHPKIVIFAIYIFLHGAIHKWHHPLMGKRGFAKRWHYSISLFSKMGDKGEGGIKNVKKWMVDDEKTLFKTTIDLFTYRNLYTLILLATLQFEVHYKVIVGISI